MQEKKQVNIFGHRGEFTKPRRVETEHGVEFHGGQNSVEAGKKAFQYCGGAEVDLTFTKDGVGVITHDKVSEMTFDEFKKKFPTHATCESWLDWLKQPGMEEKILYLDLKGGEQDPAQLVRLIHEKGLGSRISIGTKNVEIAKKLLEARQELGAGAKIYLQIPEPSAAWYFRDTESFSLNEKLGGLLPDGVHFFWPDDVIKDMAAEFIGENKFVPKSDKSVFLPTMWNPVRSLVNLFKGSELQQRRLKRFTEAAHKAGLEVIAGSSASPVVMEMMIEKWGVDAIMPNIAGHLPDGVGRPSGKEKLPDPEKFDTSTNDIFDPDSRKEKPKKRSLIDILLRRK